MDNSESEADSEDEPDLGAESEVETEAEEVLASEDESEAEPEVVEVPGPASDELDPGTEVEKAPASKDEPEAEPEVVEVPGPASDKLYPEPDSEVETEGDSKEKDELEDNMRARLEEEEMAIDETVEEFMNMEITQRKNERDLEGFEEGSNYRLKFNIWKIKTDWNLLKRNAAYRILAPADNAIKTQPAKKAKKQCSEAKKETILGKDKEDQMNDEIMSQDKCDPNVGEKNPRTLITHPATRDGTNEEQKTACDWEQSPDTELTKGATTQPSNGRTQAAVGGEPQEQKEEGVQSSRPSGSSQGSQTSRLGTLWWSSFITGASSYSCCCSGRGRRHKYRWSSWSNSWQRRRRKRSLGNQDEVFPKHTGGHE